MVYWLRVQSVSDVVTNSSSEVFVVKLTEEVKQILDTTPLTIHRLDTDRARASFVSDCLYNGDLCKLCPFLRNNPILCEGYFIGWSACNDSWFETMWNKYRDSYEPLKDCVYLNSGDGAWPLAIQDLTAHPKSTEVIL